MAHRIPGFQHMVGWPHVDNHSVTETNSADFTPTAAGAAALTALLLLVPVFGAVAQPWAGLVPILPAPVPFSLNGYDVIHAVRLIRGEPALLHVDDDGSRSITPVRTVRSFWIDFDPDAFENHQNRYDVELNGEPIDWDHLFIEYDGRMVNLRLLFTYRNQRPVPDVTYRIE